MDRASLALRDVTAQGRATTIRKVCAQLIKDRQPKELPHSEMSRVERGLQVMDAVRHPRWNAQSSLNCPDMALSRPSRATTGPMMRNTKPVSEASIQNVNPHHETAEGLVRDPDRLTEPVWACRNDGMSVDVSLLFVHHCAHHGPDKLPLPLLKHHQNHHRFSTRNYGVSTTLWDHVFGTMLR